MLTRIKQTLVKALYPFVRLYWNIFQPKSWGARSIIRHGNDILLIRTFYGQYWGLPGGTADRDETPEACAMREAFEETGVQIDIVEKLGVYRSTFEGKRDTIHIFIAEAKSRDIKKEWEPKDARWFPINALPEGIGPATRGRLEEYRSGQRAIEGTW